MRAFQTQIVMILALAACGGTTTESPPLDPERALVTATQQTPIEDVAATLPTPKEPTEVIQWAPYYSLQNKISDAEIGHKKAKLLDFGTAGGAKYTLGGWSMGNRFIVLDSQHLLASAGRQTRVHVPYEGRAKIVMHAKAPQKSSLRVFANNDEIGTADLSTELSTLAIGSADFSGETELMLRTSSSRTVDGKRIGVMLDWLWIGPESQDAIAPPESFTNTDGRIVLPKDWSLSFSQLLKAGAHFRGSIHSGEALLEVRESGKEAKTFPLNADFDVDLSAFTDFAKLTVRATTDAVLAGALMTRKPMEASAPIIDPAKKPKNVLVFLIDTLRADKLSPYNKDTRVRTPGLAAFLKDVTTFSAAHSQENWTKPSVATLLSSLMPWEHTATTGEAVVPRTVKLLPEILKDSGFYTGAFICNGYVSGKFGFRRGWNTYRNYIREGRRTRSEFVAADVLSWLDKRPTDKPFFLYVHTIDPHVPYRPPSNVLSLYGDPDYKGPVSFRSSATLLEDVKLKKVKLATRDKEQLEALYDAEITYHDVHFNAIMQGLERRGVDDETLVIVTSDHGEEFWDHGSVGHGHNVYEELLHVPLFVRMPGTKTLTRVEEAVGLVDVLPTVLDALGLPQKEGLSGKSLLPLLVGSQEAPRATVSGFMENWRTIVSGRYKLIQRPRNRSALYDLNTDSDETNDISKAHPLIVRFLRAQLGLQLLHSQPRFKTRVRAKMDDTTKAQLRALGYITD